MLYTQLEIQHLTNNLIVEGNSLAEELRSVGIDDRCLETQLIVSQQLEHFRSILVKLPEKEQELLIRKYYLDESNHEIAEQMDCKCNSIRMMLTRARRDLLQLLGKESKINENK